MSKEWTTNDLIVYFAATLINIIIYSMCYLTNKEIGTPFFYVVLILFPTLIFLAGYEKYKHLFRVVAKA